MFKKMLPEYSKAGILANYDYKNRATDLTTRETAQAREKHDLEAEFINGKRIKASEQDRWEYWKKRLTGE